MDAPIVTSLGHAGLRIDAPDLRDAVRPLDVARRGLPRLVVPVPRQLPPADPADARPPTGSPSRTSTSTTSTCPPAGPSRAVRAPRRPSVPVEGDAQPHRRRPASATSSSSSTPGSGSPSTIGATGSPSSPSCQPDVPRRRDPRRRRRPRRPAHQRRAPLRRQLRRAAEEVGRPIDVMGVQMSGASWHPICYDYPPEVDRADQRREAVWQVPGRDPAAALGAAEDRHAVCRTARLPRPRRRAAQPARRRSPGIFPRPGTGPRLPPGRLPGQTALVLLPGDRLHAGTGEVERDPMWADFTFDDTSDYLRAYAQRRADEIAAVHAELPDPEPTAGSPSASASTSSTSARCPTTSCSGSA